MVAQRIETFRRMGLNRCAMDLRLIEPSLAVSAQCHGILKVSYSMLIQFEIKRCRGRFSSFSAAREIFAARRYPNCTEAIEPDLGRLGKCEGVHLDCCTMDKCATAF